MSLPLLPGVPPLAEITASGNAIDVRTVLLVLALAGLAYALRQLALMRAEIETLRKPAAPAPVSVAPSAPAAPSPAPAAPDPLGPPTQGELVAIFAAVHSVFGGHARLVAVAPVPSSQVMWSLEGRREVFRSHQIR